MELEGEGEPVLLSRGAELKAQYYWISTDPGSTISFDFKTIVGEVSIHYLRSQTFGLGDLYCWVDKDRSKDTRMEGWWPLEFNIAQ
jgi:hypothetical protein